MGKLINSIAEIYKKQDETGVIMADTVLLACGCTPANIETFANHGIKEVPAVLEQRVKFDDLSDETLISNLFKLEQDDLDQLPISFFSEIAKSEALKNLSHDSQTTVFNKIFHTIGIESLQDLQNTEAEKVAYNHKEYKAIFDAFFSFNYKEQAKEVTQYFDQIVDQKLNEVLDKAPELTNNSEKRNEITQLNEKHNGNLMEASEEALSLFEDTKELKKENLQGLGLDKNFEQYSFNTAKSALAQYKLGAYAEAAKAKGLINEATAEKYSVVNPAEKENPVNKFVNAAKNTMANFAKPQSLAKIGFRTLATKALQHVTEGAVPGIGAAVGLAMKLGECGKKIFKDKRKASEVFKEAAPDLVRGVVTVGTSFTPLAAIAGPIGTVASIATRGIQGAHQEGLKLGHGFLKRVFSEFTKKGNAINLGASVLGAGLGFGVKEYMEHMNGVGEELGVTAADNVMGNVENAEMNVDADALVNDTEINAEMGAIPSQTSTEQVVTTPNPTPTEEITPTEPTLSYAEQCLKNDPDVKADKNGWLFKENANGQPVYIKDASGKMVGLPGAKKRELFDYETLDAAGNIVNKVNEVTEPEMTATFEKPTLEDFKNERHAEIFEEMQERDDPTVAPTTQTVEETVSHEISNQEPMINRENVIHGYQDPTVEPATTEVEKAVEINEPAIEAQFATREAVENATVKDVDIEAVENATVKDVDVEIEEQVKTEPLTVRSPEELAKIDELAKKAADARNFNSLPENQQRELIDIKAKAIVAQEQGNNAAYEEYKKEFDSKFKDYVAEDKRLDEISRQANIPGTSENQQRESLISYVSTLSGEQQVEGIRILTEKYGMDMGDGANGVRQYVRYGGSLKMEVPEVPDKNLLEQGYTQQADGTWLKENKFGSRVVTDVNQNGIQDAGDLYTEKTSFAGFSSETSGHIADYEQEKINPQYNAQTALDEAVARERAMQQDQGLEL